MKRISIWIITTLLFSSTTYSQVTTEKFTIDNIPVIMKHTAKDIIDVGVYYRGGVADFNISQAGIGNLALTATTECGTQKYSRDEFKNIADRYGISLGGFSTYDYGKINLNCITKYFDKGWDLLVEAVNHPVFNEKDLSILKEKVLSGIRNSEADPDSKLQEMAIEGTFKGTPYEIDPNGDTSSIPKLTAEMVKNFYYQKLLDKNKMFIVVVGKISKEAITEKIKEAFGDISSASYTPPVYHVPEIDSNSLNVQPRKLATNYIMGIVNAPSYTSKDFVANRLAMASYSDDLFTEIRTKRNLSYAPYAYTVQGQIPYSLMYVSTTDPKAAVQVMADEIKKFKTKGFTEKEFTNIRNLYITANYMKNESTSAIASSYGIAEVLGNWKMADEFIDLARKTTPAEMTAVFKKYVKGISWSYLGDPKAAEDAKSAFDTSVE
jgi:zinc protease